MKCCICEPCSEKVFCSSCQEKIDKGFVIFVEVDDQETTSPIKPENAKRTGRTVYMMRHLAERIFKDLSQDVFYLIDRKIFEMFEDYQRQEDDVFSHISTLDENDEIGFTQFFFTYSDETELVRKLEEKLVLTAKESELLGKLQQNK